MTPSQRLAKAFELSDQARSLFLAGLRTSIGRAIVDVIVAEFFMSSKGLGYFINLKANALEMAFVAIVLLAFFGITLVSLVTYIENRFCNW